MRLVELTKIETWSRRGIRKRDALDAMFPHCQLLPYERRQDCARKHSRKDRGPDDASEEPR